MCKYSSDLIYQYMERTEPFFKSDLLANVELKTLLDVNGSFFLSIDNTKSAGEIVRELIKVSLDSKIKLAIGDWLKRLAVFINEKVYGGIKPEINGIDLEFGNNNMRNIVSIKSGSNWGNDSQIKKMLRDFNSAKKVLKASGSKVEIVCVNGCCYGRDNNPDKGTYYKYCGQRFWAFIGGDENIYTDIIEPLGHRAKERNDDYLEKYAQTINRFTKEFNNLFCDNDGKINWKRLVEYNSNSADLLP